MTRRPISTGSPFEAQLGCSRAVVQGDWGFMAGVTGYDCATMPLAPVLSDRLGEVRPAAMTVVSGLMRPEMRYEVEVSAFRGP